MSKHTFYDVHGNRISSSKFINMYNEIYYYQNNCFLEREIERIYSKGCEASLDEMITFIKWKTGGELNNSKDSIITQYGSHISIDGIKELEQSIDSSWREKNVCELYNLINDHNIENIGPVYILALCSLIKSGTEPIYDKFTDIALDAIGDDTKVIWASISYKEMPDKKSERSVMKRYDSFKDKLKVHFGNEWQKDRNIDRALWVYGHMFR